MTVKAPFPWFGGKRRVAGIVWQAFGQNVKNYIEPFFGSGAVLLGRPGGPGKIETINDRDRMVANFWRAVTAAPHHADWPVNEADLHARHVWLVAQLPSMRIRMHEDPHYYDALIAGWWVWGICQWIGGGWCVETNNHKHPKLDGIGMYGEDELGLSKMAARWAIEHGEDPDLRIALCGYEANWTKYEWKAARGYSGKKNSNRHLERIWFSPHCLLGQQELSFERGEDDVA
jgi:hypothetical protein